MSNENTRITQERWSDTESTANLRAVYWTSSQVIARYLNRRCTGDPNADWLTWLDHVVLRPTGRELDCLVLGCGEGWLERALAPSPAVRSILAMDISPRAVEKAARMAAEQGLDGTISYRAANLDHDPLPTAAFNVVIAHSVLHHVEELEFAYEQIAESLRPGGLLVIHEYVGNCRLQYGDDQIERMNAIVHRLPAHFRRSALTGEVFTERVRPPLDVVTATDPSEGIRSEEVLTAAAAHFEIVRHVDLGGSILQPLLYELAPNFSDTDPDHRAILELMVLLEESLIDARVLASDFVFTLAKRLQDQSLAFDLPNEPINAGTAPLPCSPWLTRSRLPETGGVSTVLEHLAERVTGEADGDPVDWIVQQARTGFLRPLRLARARLLETGDFETALRSRFRSLAIGWPTAENDEPCHAFYSLATLGVVELADATVVDRMADAIVESGSVILLIPCREPNQVPTEAIRTKVRAAARSLPGRFDLSPLFAPLPAEFDSTPPVDLVALRHSLERRFTVSHWKALGWPILNVLIPVLAHQLNPEIEEDATLLSLLCLLDQQLVDDSVLPTDYLLVVAKKKKPGNADSF